MPPSASRSAPRLRRMGERARQPDPLHRVFYALLTNSNSWASAIVNSFRSAANQAVTASGGQSLIAPSDIFAIGLNMANKVLDQTSIWSPQSSAGLIIFALVLVVCFALIAAFLVLALVNPTL